MFTDTLHVNQQKSMSDKKKRGNVVNDYRDCLKNEPW